MYLSYELSFEDGNTTTIDRQFEVTKAERLTDVYTLLSLLSLITSNNRPVLRVVWHFVYPNLTYLEVVPLISNSKYQCKLLPSEITHKLLGLDSPLVVAKSDGTRVTSDKLSFELHDTYIRPFCPLWNRPGDNGKDGLQGDKGPRGKRGPQGDKGPTGYGSSYRQWHIVN